MLLATVEADVDAPADRACDWDSECEDLEEGFCMRLRRVGIDDWLMRRREERRRKVVKVGRMEGEEASIRLRTSFCKFDT